MIIPEIGKKYYAIIPGNREHIQVSLVKVLSLTEKTVVVERTEEPNRRYARNSGSIADIVFLEEINE